MAGVSKLAREAGLDPVRCPHCGQRFSTRDVIDRFFELVAEAAAGGERVHIKDFGVFYVKVWPGRRLKTPLMRGGQVSFGPSLVLRFTASSVIKRLINTDRFKSKFPGMRKRRKR